MNDRGTKKWTSLMMPEQIRMLDELWAEDNNKIKPILDEQLMVDINLKMQLALEHDLTIEIEYFKEHDYHKVKGKLLGVDPLNNYVRIEDLELPFDSLTGAWVEEAQTLR